MIKKLIMAVIILAFWAVYYFQNHYSSDTTKPVEKSKTENVDINAKKMNFFEQLRPGFEKENQRVESERSQLLELQSALAEKNVSSGLLKKASTLAQMYDVSLPEEGVTKDWLSDMFIRVNILPEALVLTQAANESAWGTSRFARDANNFFGQWCYSEGCGLVPSQRVEGATHEVAKFDNPQASIHAYFMNVNRNDAYKELRNIRQSLAEKKVSLSSTAAALELTNGLLSYSERGQDYINDLQSMIKQNKNYWKN
ncbi:glucosaminidase domain-containing protein [Vibrio hibernica]|uniref:glucosaminidase domain-containing protein n=1 Tax=Vibrio hibernica TaxID=2587465 RepID=UPI00187F3455|nr:glucosaminidase domain-containing protein [Vibrio hibernica]